MHAAVKCVVRLVPIWELKRLRPPLKVKGLQARGAYGSQVHENGNVMHEAGSVICLVKDRRSKSIVPRPVLGGCLRLG